MYGFQLSGLKAGSENGDVQSAGASPDTLRVPGLEAVASWNKKDKAAGENGLSPAALSFLFRPAHSGQK